jgi:hypothetical protein
MKANDSGVSFANMALMELSSSDSVRPTLTPADAIKTSAIKRGTEFYFSLT